MQPRARRALAVIRRCIAKDRYVVLAHFRDRMQIRGIVWPDVLAVIDAPTGVRSEGLDQFHRPKWILRGLAADGLSIEIVCAIDRDESGDETVFITVY